MVTQVRAVPDSGSDGSSGESGLSLYLSTVSQGTVPVSVPEEPFLGSDLWENTSDGSGFGFRYGSWGVVWQ